MKFRTFSFLGTVVFAAFVPVMLSAVNAEEKVIRVGYFPNITHSQALIGIAKGTFQKELGRDVKIDTKIFNAGPSVIKRIK